MNKKLLTVAVVTALCASPAVFADADVYGKIDIGVQVVDPGSGYSGEKIFVDDRQGSGGSLIGWSASEDLGGGMKGIAKVEMGFFTDTGSLDNTNSGTNNPATNAVTNTNVQLAQRQVWAGLAGGFGSVTAGRQYRELFLIGNSYGAYAYTNGLIGTFFLNGGVGVRQSNYIKYASPTFGGGLKFTAGYDPQGTADDRTTPGGGNAGAKGDKFQDFSLAWSSGPLHLGVAIGTNTLAGVDTDSTVVAGNYTFGPNTIYGLYSKTDLGVADITATSVNYKYKAGQGDFIFVYGISSPSATNSDSTLMAVSYYYHLGKQTTVYAGYGTMDNDPGAAASLARQAVATTGAGQDPSAFNFGVTKTF